jgi:hypothetical protein
MRFDMRVCTIVFTLIWLSAAPVLAQERPAANRSVQPLPPMNAVSVKSAARVAQGIVDGVATLPGPLAGQLANFGDLATAGALGDAVVALNETMADFEPDYSPNGMPRIPVSCGYIDEERTMEANASCTSCFREATNQISAARVDFERMRAVGQRTKVFVDAALAFGDSYSTVAGNGSLGWPQSRPEVLASWDDFKLRYDTSYQSQLAKLDAGLRALDACEAAFFDNHDWYNREGFIFFAFMEARYELE